MLSRRSVDEQIVLLAQVFHWQPISKILTLIILIIDVGLLLKVVVLLAISICIHEPDHLLVVLHVRTAHELLTTLQAKLIMLLTCGA